MRQPPMVLRLASVSALLMFGCDSRQPLERLIAPSSALVRLTEVTVFHANVKGPPTHWGENRSSTLPYWPGCSDGAFVCASATITGFGKAQYSFHLDSFARISSSCAEYGATVVFTLQDASALMLTEIGTVCGPGGSFIFVPAPGGSFGNPVEGNGSWTVESGTGQFSGMTGNGTDSFLSAGANTIATYMGDLSN